MLKVNVDYNDILNKYALDKELCKEIVKRLKKAYISYNDVMFNFQSNDKSNYHSYISLCNLSKIKQGSLITIIKSDDDYYYIFGSIDCIYIFCYKLDQIEDLLCNIVHISNELLFHFL